MVITIGSFKGGCGKTTLATNLAINLKNSLLVDADKQKSASEFKILRNKKLNCTYDVGILADRLNSYKKKYKHVIVDPAGRNSKELVSALYCTDLLIIPTLASQVDLCTLHELENQVEIIKKSNNLLKSYILLNKISTNHNSKIETNCKKYLQESHGFEIMQPVLKYRVAYQQAFAEGLSVTESSKYKKAGCEIEKIISFIERGKF